MPLYDPALRYFLAVFESGSINGAARQLYVAASAVSRQIGRLEKELGAPLFERLPSGVVPTDAANAFAGFARRAIQEAGQVIDLVHERQTAETLISIAAPIGVGHDFVPRVAAEYRNIHSGARFVLHLTDPAAATQMVRDGAADLAVTFNLKVDAGVEIVNSRPAPLVAVVRKGHPLQERALVSFPDLCSYPLALSAPNSTNRHLFDLVSSSANRAVEPVFVCENPDALLSFLDRDDTVTLLGRITIYRDLESGRVVAIPLKEKELRQRNLQVQTQAGRKLPGAVERFVEFLVEALDRSDA